VSEPAFRPATTGDLDALVQMMRAFYAHEGIGFDPDVARPAMRGLLEDGTRGRAWLVVDSEGPAGYVVLTLGWSLEYGGRDAFLDEIFLAERLRGRRLGERAIDLALEACRALGVRALHLEVERANARAQSLYRRLGFADHDRYLMTKWLVGPKATG
jgi:ribosomal protein S18 acetylase RimI-like enzyme